MLLQKTIGGTMTSTSAEAAPGSAGMAARASGRVHPLFALLLLALVLRLAAAVWPNVIYPDETFQYLEPAWRMLGHDGILTWEWRDGIRGWFLPTLMAGPVALGDAIAPAGAGAFLVPRLIAACASLSIVVSAWLLGARVSRTHAVVTAFAAAVWFELIMLAPHTLGEPLATALIVPAALLVTDRPSPRRLAIGGALLAFAFVCRFQFAPAIAVLALGACWTRWRNLVPLVAGGLVALLLAAAIDLAHGSVPFAWLIANIRENLVHDRAIEFGVSPPSAYLIDFMTVWSVAILLPLAAIWRGWRHAPLLATVALVNLVFHSLIAHKEYRFIFLSVVLLTIVAALGSADWVQWLRTKVAWRRWALPIVLGGWALLSVALAGASEDMREYWTRGVGAARLAAELRSDPQMCGLALYDVRFQQLPGRERLVGPVPLYALQSADPLAELILPPLLLRATKPAFNRILARPEAAGDLPADFSRQSCARVGFSDACIYARGGSCDASAAAPFVINDVLVRIGW
ncbi:MULTISPECIES: 4-amino-4-deoxy-L-arabinose transferase [unclassified Bradyrhizobium]|uniref:4-amino-4-deoxy-L-arabinose transferase n=1 Tax=unclassified Bradyrhizobium TaxID=2631580 RepID=UPI001BA7ED7B|nr:MULTISPECIES: 4-amino-4-deoxy-L-arabinose transferase [unclassified Bradyrhizobium]MBR1201272.1 4-amino-4-deoxy-L-arabinose transferase [Bradyrhizobium sp. AUGA SZCCT0124]MBR1316802.1 4-amino-4-deoxy-L-arabinose transferase [Bradyrhizobium sp. AUGA SZCCT0051]MBR1345089.1 4-amino-4-deoxy-L-arabinose transferase [Bradyrhizobium sp. AUGA SZCCT0105]MBR1359812.1 4-amino-4-deoxy-L-arabinose transferase [Bradyrhizobium sp. AUGA SZCCT0045]